jgi:hypothetical protein
MELFKKIIVAVVITFGLILGGCGESVDPNMADVQMKMKAISSLGSFDASGRVMDNHITFNQVLLGVTEIEFESMVEDHDDDGDDHSSDNDSDDGSMNDDDMDENAEGDDSDYEIEFEGEFIVDLIAGTSTPDFGISDVIPGTYEELEVEIEPILDDGNSLFIELTYQPEGSDPLTIQYSTNRSFKLEIEKDKGFELNEGTLNQILVLFDLDQLLAGLDLEQANVDEDGVIRINSESNSNLANAIWDKLGMAFDAGEDDDGDDEFDDDLSHSKSRCC